MPLDLPSWRSYAAVALASGALLLFEIGVTRVLSVVLWYHFAFLAVSLAMLAIGLPGVWLTVYPSLRPRVSSVLLAAGIAAAVSIPVLFKVGALLTPVDALGGASAIGNARVLLSIAVIFPPLLGLGAAICLLLTRSPGRSVASMYGADLLGATAGAFAVVPLMQFVPTPLLVAGSGLLPVLAAGIVDPGRVKAAAALGLAVVAALAYGEPFRLAYTKRYVERADSVLYEKWTPTARITVLRGALTPIAKDGAAFMWGAGEDYTPPPVEQLWLDQDGGAGTPITRLVGSPKDLEFLQHDVTSVGYQLVRPGRVCVVGAGGGRDVLTALASGATDVRAVELNPAIIGVLSGPLRDFGGDVYHLPGVTPVVGEGRSYLARSEGGFDLVQISLIDSWAATAAGAFALSENYLYTTEALRLYLRKCSDRGVVSISRWASGARAIEADRLAALAVEALRLEGVASPEKHIAVVQAGAAVTFLLSRAEIGPDGLVALEKICDEQAFTLRWPTPPGASPDALVPQALEGESMMLVAMGFDVTPPTDDRPFFFQTVSVFSPPDRYTLAQSSANENSVALLRLLLAILGVATAALFFAPFALSGGVRMSKGFWSGSLYFVAIGVGFMLIEIPLMQKFVLYLEHPSYATTVVLSTLLLGAGVGSLLASRVSLSVASTLGLVLPFALAALDFGLGPFFGATQWLPFAARVALSALVLVPTGLLLGFPFPAGMIAFGELNRAWFWALNGAAGVLASVAALVLSIGFGFFVVMMYAAAFYVLAGLVLLRAVGEPEEAPAADAGLALGEGDTP